MIYVNNPRRIVERLSKKDAYHYLLNFEYYLNLLKLNIGLYKNLDWEEIRQIFIISTGRTGTKFLAKLLNNYSSVFSVHEPRPHFLRLGYNYAIGNSSFEEARKKIKKFRIIQLKKISVNNQTFYIEANNRLFSLIPVLKSIYPNSKFIHIIRDGRDIVRSGMNRNWYKSTDHTFRLQAVDFIDDIYNSKWNSMNRFEKICWLWQKKDGIIYRDLKKSESFIQVKFKDIFENEKYVGLRKITNFLNLDFKNIDLSYFNKKINATSKYKFPHWTDWNKEQINRFWEIAGNHMKKLKYENN